MKRFAVASFILLAARFSLAAACCTGGSSKTFVGLAELQKYEIGFSTSFKDEFGRYNAYGELNSSERNQWFTTSIAVAGRIFSDLEFFTMTPLVWRRSGPYDETRFTLGDIVLGMQYRLVETTFEDDWYPNIRIHYGVKAPTGGIEAREQGRVLPGAGNGIWEPFAGLAFEKPLWITKLGLRFTYTKRFERDGIQEGDLFELAETSNFVLTPRWNVVAGMSQSWITPLALKGHNVPDSQSRVWNVFLSTQYFVTQLWSLGGGLEISLPWERFGMNEAATQAITFTTKYAIF